MRALPSVRTAVPLPARKAINQMLPDPHPSYRIARRVAGVGSLGHARYVAIFDWKDAQLALETKEASPSACAWANPDRSQVIHYQQMLDKAVRCKDPFVCLTGKWLTRHLLAKQTLDDWHGWKDAYKKRAAARKGSH